MMKNPVRKVKLSLLISMFSVVICLAGIVFAAMNLKYSAVDGKATGAALTLFWGVIAVSCSNVTLFIINLRKYKNCSG